MIRPAEPKDLPAIIKMGAAFWDESGFDDFLGERDDFSLLDLYTEMISSGTIMVAGDDELLGMLGGAVFPHPMNTSKLMAQEMFWWVKPEHRRSSIGKELLEAFEARCAELGAVGNFMITLHGVGHERVGRVYTEAGYRPFEYIYFKRL